MYFGFDKVLNTLKYFDSTMVRTYKHLSSDTKYVGFELHIIGDFIPCFHYIWNSNDMTSRGMRKGPTHPPELPVKYKDMYMNGMASVMTFFFLKVYARI